MQQHIDGVEMYYAKDRKAWHEWLKKNHASKKSVWLIYYKPASGKTRVSYNDAVDEAICFGWIDSKPNKLDEFRSIQFFAPRKPKSNWSKINKERAERLIKEKRMQPAGLAVIKQAKINGSWDALNEVEEMTIPDDLQKELEKNKKAKEYFMAFPKSSKRNILEWILNAKQTETRNKRINETVRLAKDNIRANHYRQPKTK
ncbi:MAG: YdeI/OmpD-associated family protein [Bacteroidetes bacterium]|nr:YdeI/OmpD-associated family protein [Bacteroidota bacterium]